jgi:hypothetical protein
LGFGSGDEGVHALAKPAEIEPSEDGADEKASGPEQIVEECGGDPGDDAEA